MSDVVVVYHTKTKSIICHDGFLSATIAWRVFGDSAEYIATTYSDSLNIDTFVDKDVYFVDFSYEVDRMDQINAVAKSLHVFDHHMPKAESYRGREYAVFSNTKSGSVLVWEHFYPNLKIPTMLEIIDDGDRYVNKHPDLIEFVASLSIEPQTFERWSQLLDELEIDTPSYSAFIARGVHLAKQDMLRVDSLAKDAFPIILHGIKGLCVNTNKFYAHYTALKLASSSGTFGAAFYLRSDGKVEVSLRSRDPDINVFAIAESFGGGGHRCAAAFAVPFLKFKELLQPESKNEFYTRIENVTKQFQHYLSSLDCTDKSCITESFYNHLCSELGQYIGQDIGFTVEESASHPKLMVRLFSKLALLLGLSKEVYTLRWYHTFFPYVESTELEFDEDSIKQVLLESNDSDRDFFVKRLYDTVNAKTKYILPTSTYYIHISVNLPGSPLKVNHSFELIK
jgi:oligoribonuclease NrnB/cAMP/cGMP phosphodiesterase (DHH superfamily)